MSKYKDYMVVDWSSIVEYDETVESCLRWKKDLRPVTYKIGNYYCITVKKKNYRVHRIVYLLKYNVLCQNSVVDHIDGNTLNNRMSNLRVIGQDLNLRNCKKSKLNTSGKTGVTFDSKQNRWVTQWWSLDKHRRKKTFSVSKYGYELAFDLACKFREQVIAELNTQGAGYTDRHGV